MTFYKILTKHEQRQLRQQFLSCIAKKEYLIATQTLYQYSLVLGKSTEIKNNKLTERLNKLAFQGGTDIDSSLTFSIDDAKALITQIASKTAKNVKESNFTHNEAIKLNKQ